MLDKGHFPLYDGVNKKNYRIWGTENLHQIHDTPLKAKKVTVWTIIFFY